MSLRKDSFVWAGVGLAVLGIVAAGFFFLRTQQSITTVRLGDGVFSAQVVVTSVERQKGLSGVKNLPDHKAMLFVHNADQVNNIWMKDMKIPIDVVWLDAAKKVVHIETSLQPNSYPKTYGPSFPTRYVIELADGVVAKKGIAIGDQAEFEVQQ